MDWCHRQFREVVFYTPLNFLNTPEKYTLSIGLRYFYNSLATEGEPMLHLLMAAAMLSLLPPIILFMFTQRYFIRGVVMSGLKGLAPPPSSS